MYRADRVSRGKWGWRRLLSPVFLGISLVVVVVALSIFIITRPKEPIPAAIVKQAGFTLFYPSELPDTYKIDPESFDYRDARVSYSLTSPSKPKILVTIQAKPADYDTEYFNQKLPGRSGLETPNGTAVIGQAGNSKLSSLISDGAWVLISTSSQTPDKAFNQVTKSLSATDN